MCILHVVCDLILNRVAFPPVSLGLQNNDQIIKIPDQRLFQIPDDIGKALGEEESLSFLSTDTAIRLVMLSTLQT